MKLLLSVLTLMAFSQVEAQQINCENNRAGAYTCQSVALMAELDLSRSGRRASSGTDIWGWTDPDTGREYALVGLNSKTAFVDITDATNPVHIGDLKTKTFSSKWRDIKVYGNYALIVSEAWGHGMQIFDLTRLRGNLNRSLPLDFNHTVHYDLFGSAHNVFVNEDTGYAYVVGSNTCDKGAHVVDVRDPLNPKFATCLDRSVYDLPLARTASFDVFSAEEMMDGETYTHDIQCVVYNGPDADYQGHEVCISSNEDTVNITDVTDKTNAYQISAIDYSQTGYTHQGWLSEDQRYFFLGDELDEMNFGVNTTTLVFDLSDLDAPKLHMKYVADTKAIDHNLYTHNGYIYQANYNAGLRILDYSEVDKGILKEVAYFDTDPAADSAKFDGIWSVYPYFKSGNVVLSHINKSSLFIVRPNLAR